MFIFKWSNAYSFKLLILIDLFYFFSADLKNRKKKPLGPCGSMSNILSVESEEMVPMVSEDKNKNGNVTFLMDSITDPSNIEDI